jgi:hypothetical protein
MKNFLKWLSTSPIAAILKVAIGGLLATAFDAIDSFHLPASVALGITAVIPVIIDALNPHDPRFGKGKQPSLQDLIDAIKPVLEKVAPAEAPIVEAVTPVIEAAVDPKKS